MRANRRRPRERRGTQHVSPPYEDPAAVRARAARRGDSSLSPSWPVDGQPADLAPTSTARGRSHCGQGVARRTALRARSAVHLRAARLPARGRCSSTRGRRRFAFVWVAIAQVTLAASLIWSLRHALALDARSRCCWRSRSRPIWAASRRIVIAFVGAVALAGGQARGRVGLALAARARRALRASSCSLKLNTGVTVPPSGRSRSSRRRVPRRAARVAFARAVVVALLAGWVATGQSFGADLRLPHRLARDRLGLLGGDDLRGPADASGSRGPRRCSAALGLLGRVARGRGAAAARAVGLVALWAVLAFTAFKAAFVRHDPVHTNIYFASLLGGLVAFGWAPHRRQTALLLGALFAVTLLALRHAARPAAVLPAAARGELLRPAARC